MVSVKIVSTGLWQSEKHKLAISYNEGGRSRKYDWDIVQDGKLLIKNARTQKIKGLKDGTIYIEVLLQGKSGLRPSHKERL